MNETQTIVNKSFLAKLALIFACLALGLSIWQYYTTQQVLDSTQKALDKRLYHENDSTKTLRAMIGQTINTTHALQDTLTTLEARVNESAGQYATLNTMYQALTKNHVDWVLSEVEHTLVIANQQLQLLGNVPAAITALELAEARLSHYSRPKLTNLKNALARDLEWLKAQPYLDTVGLSNTLDQLSTLTDSLPLISGSHHFPADVSAINTAPDAAPLWSRAFASLRQSLSELIRIRRMDAPDLALLSPEQAFFLKENIKMRLLDARLALLQRNAKTFWVDLAAAEQYVQRYFDTNTPLSKQWLSTFKKLKDAPVDMRAPNALNSLNAAREIQQTSGEKP